ncbi:MAG TPA: PilZ domain-containing protein [Myxococcota bacterium]|jgi:hypothetical protein|nr:PilZ domain-containing protein [Myxococcota bacterium]
MDGSAKLQERRAASRRATTRLDVAVPVLLCWGGHLARGIARNVSSGGAFVQTTHRVPLGTPLKVVFGVGDGGRELAAHAEVKHQVCLNYVDPSSKSNALIGIGLRFTGFETHLPTDYLDA